MHDSFVSPGGKTSFRPALVRFYFENVGSLKAMSFNTWVEKVELTLRT